WVSSPFNTASCRIFPLRFGRQSKTVYKLLAPTFLIIVLELGPPVAKGLCLLPRNTHHRIIAIGIVPKVIIVHWLIRRVSEILHPYRSIRIYLQFLLFYKILSISLFGTGRSLNIHPGVFVFQFGNIYVALAVIGFLLGN